MAKRKKRDPVPNMGKEELAVFQFIQKHSPITVREVADHFADSGKARTTILTVMERLREKGLLEREKVSGAYRYQPAVDASLVMKSLVGDFVQRVLGGSLSPFMAYMSEANELTAEELTQLKEIVRELESKNPKTRGKSK